MKEIIRQKAGEINKILEPFVPVSDGKNDILSEAMAYALTAGGKRLRPLLMLESSRLFTDEACGIYDFMAAIEMIHNYSLIHDDLPAMDNDLIRHGKPSVHAVYGEAMAILAGDGLLNLAFETVTDCLVKYPDSKVCRAASVLAKAAGAQGMIGGQAVEISFDGTKKRPESADIDYIYLNKTARLIMAPLEIGGILGGADSNQTDSLRRIGECIGIAFQIEDDILDIVGDESVIGKPVGSDAENDKYTYVAANGIDKARTRVKSLTDEAIERLLSLPGDTGFLKNLFEYLIGRDS